MANFKGYTMALALAATAIGGGAMFAPTEANAQSCGAGPCTPPPPPPPPPPVTPGQPTPPGVVNNGGNGGNSTVGVSVSTATNATGGTANATTGDVSLTGGAVNIGGSRSYAFAAPGGPNLGGIGGVNGGGISNSLESDCMRAATVARQSGFTLPVVGGGLANGRTQVDQTLYAQCIAGATDRADRNDAMTVAGALCQNGNTDGTRAIFENVATTNRYLTNVAPTVQCGAAASAPPPAAPAAGATIVVQPSTTVGAVPPAGMPVTPQRRGDSFDAQPK